MKGNELWATYARVTIFGVLLGTVVGLYGNINDKNEKIAELQATLSDPHHCVSYCADAWAEFGC